MKKKIALALTSLLMLTALLTTSYFASIAIAPVPPIPGPGGVYHWKIMLAQKGCNAWIVGWLTFQGAKIPNTDFFLNCTCELPEPQPLGQFVFWKQNTTVVPTDIHYIKYIDLDKNGVPDITEPIDAPITGDWPKEPHTWYKHVEEGETPHHWMVVVEVRNEPYDAKQPFQWQLEMKTHGGVTASWSGDLTKGDAILPGTSFNLVATGDFDTDLQCDVVETAFCTVPNNIESTLTVDGFPITVDDDVTQFPWTFVYSTGPTKSVTLELTEVQMHKYVVMAGGSNTGGKLGTNPTWNKSSWIVDDGVPFCTRAPYFFPKYDSQYVTFQERDPITGIVELGILTEGYSGLNHAWYSADVGTWFRSHITLEIQGCGWIFTGVGEQPVLGSVDLLTYNTETGVYTYGADGVAKTGDDELLAGTVVGMGPGGSAGSAGAGPPIGPCLQLLRGPDGIPGTGDDPIGRGDPDGPDEPGSGLQFLPSTNTVWWWDNAPKIWKILYTVMWPQLLTTGTAKDTVMDTKVPINGQSVEQTGAPWEFFAGIDHPEYGDIPWKHSKCNAYSSHVTCWSVCLTDTDLGRNDIIFESKITSYREDCVIGDVDGNELVDIMDILVAGMAFGGEDEYYGPDGIPMTADDKKIADNHYNAMADISDDRGLIDIMDILVMAMDFGKTLTPACIILP